MSILLTPLSEEEFPQLGLAIGVYSRPGCVLIESSILRVLRYTMAASFLLSPVAIALMKRRLPFAARPNFPSVPMFFKLNTYTFWGGAAVGTVGAIVEAQGRYANQPDDDGLVDMVDDVVALRKSDIEFRYSFEAARAMSVVSTVLVLMGNQGNIWQRFSVGCGIGVVLATSVCAFNWDKASAVV